MEMSDGSYVKFADGTLICWGNYQYTFTSAPYQAINIPLPTVSVSNGNESGALHHDSMPNTPVILVNFSIGSSGTYGAFGLRSVDQTSPGHYTQILHWNTISSWK